MRLGGRIIATLVLGLVLALLGVRGPAGAAGHASAGSPNSSAVRSWMKLHDVVFLSLQTDLKTLSTDDENGSTTAISAACQQLEADLTTITHVHAIPDGTAERHWRLALSDFRQGAGDCVRGILRNNGTLEKNSGPLLRSGVSQVNDVLSVLKG
jgi:hypothetical protein